MIIADERNPKAQEMAKTLGGFFPNGLPEEAPTIVIGGDGFLLYVAHTRGLNETYMGLNAGYLGFLLNDVDNWEAIAHRLESRKWKAWEFPTIEAEIRCENGEVIRERAVNDVYLERMSGQTARLGLSVDGEQVVETLVSDGIVFATALGSTAYTYSAGGPVCHPTLEVLAVTPICPHKPRLAPFALPATARVDIEVQKGAYRPVRAVADGRDTDHVESVHLALSQEKVRLAYFLDHDFTSLMVRKILHP
jgi:NAD+ kinase